MLHAFDRREPALRASDGEWTASEQHVRPGRSRNQIHQTGSLAFPPWIRIAHCGRTYFPGKAEEHEVRVGAVTDSGAAGRMRTGATAETPETASRACRGVRVSGPVGSGLHAPGALGRFRPDRIRGAGPPRPPIGRIGVIPVNLDIEVREPTEVTLEHVLDAGASRVNARQLRSSRRVHPLTARSGLPLTIAPVPRLRRNSSGAKDSGWRHWSAPSLPRRCRPGSLRDERRPGAGEDPSPHQRREWAQ